jgi:UDP-GlcNAc:undecaprenyl-phosphate/decaprenyl-phosphate GlcNAc-1-phosphate transferase
MVFLLVALGSSCGLCLLLIPLVRRLALHYGLVDQPDGHRKIHKKPTPVAGGLAILASCVLVIGALFLVSNNWVTYNLRLHWPTILSLLLGALVICALGMADDLGKLRGRYKLVGQIVAASVVVSFGTQVSRIHFFGMNIELGWFGIPFTVFFLVGTINSLNLIDGMDGLLGSVGTVLSLSLAVMACISGYWWAALVAMALAGALMGFLRYNLIRATIFLGDSGSMLIGLVLGTLSIQCSLKAPATLAIMLPLGLLVLPIFDTTAAIIRRKLTGRSIYTTDRGHLHHCLQRTGLSTSGTVAVIFLFCLIACTSVLASQAFENEYITLITVVSIVACLVVSKLFGHAEAMLIKGRLSSLLLPTKGPHHMEVRLQGTINWDNLWQALKNQAAELNLKGILLDVNAPFLHEGYYANWGKAGESDEGKPLWHVEVPMASHGLSLGRLVISGQPDDQPVWVKIAAVMRVLDAFNAGMGAANAPPPEPAVPAAKFPPSGSDVELEVLKS